uniref:Galectin n=1 Tax=Syphacia muris TaxID=451379 RepID=A0A0N5AZY2_9BILA
MEAVPYLSKLEGNHLQPGQSLIVRGFITESNEFIISLTGGPKVEKEDGDDYLDNRLLLIRVNIAKRRIYLNACINGEWGKEGSVKHKWKPGDEFDVRLRSMEKHFEIYVEHKLVANFAYYVPVANITHIYINGDVELYTVSWEGKFYQIPYAADIPGNFHPGRKLYISAILKRKGKQFIADFYSGSDIAFRIKPRIIDKKLSKNTRFQDQWGTENNSIETSFPFKHNRSFDLMIYCEESRFLIYVNDCLTSVYDHRMNPRSIDKLGIDGDIELLGVHLK